MSEQEKKTTRGRPKKIVTNPETPIEKKAKGRPRTDKPLTERRKLYDLRFSLKKLNMVEDDITINKNCIYLKIGFIYLYYCNV